MSVVTAHMVYFCAFTRSDIFPKNARKLGVGRGQFDAGVNGLISKQKEILFIIQIVKTGHKKPAQSSVYQDRVFKSSVSTICFDQSLWISLLAKTLKP